MAKNKNRGNKSVSEMRSELKRGASAPVLAFPLPVPEKFSRDTLVDMTDEQLGRRSADLLTGLTYVKSECSLPPTPWEVELTYVNREIDNRVTRREAHAAYIAGRR